MNKTEIGISAIEQGERMFTYMIENYDIDSILAENLTDNERMFHINSYGEKLAQICEFYLKGLFVQNMEIPDSVDEKVIHDEDKSLRVIVIERFKKQLSKVKYKIVKTKEETKGILDPMSEEESDAILFGKYGLKKYSHYLRSLFTKNKFLDSSIKEHILMELSYMLDSDGIDEDRKKANVQYFKSMGDNVSNSLAESLASTNPQMIKEIKGAREYNATIRRLQQKIKEQISKSDDAYPESRYAVFSGYVADIDFLYKFVLAIRSAIPLVHNAIFFKNANRFIFPDSGLDLKIIVGNYDGGISQYVTDGNNLFYCDENNELDLCLNPQLEGEFVMYIKNGETCIIKENKVIKGYAEYKGPNLKVLK